MTDQEFIDLLIQYGDMQFQCSLFPDDDRIDRVTQAVRLYRQLVNAFSQTNAESQRYREALQEIFDFTNGYGDVGGIANRMAHKAISPDVFEGLED